MEGDFAALSAKELVTKSVEELRSLIQERREKREQERAEREERLAQGAEAGPREIPDSKVHILQGHGAEVFSCCWNPTANFLASG